MNGPSIFVNGEDLTNKYPGFHFKSSSETERVFVSEDNKRKIVEVLGSDEGEFGRSKVITILSTEDAALYEKLQWKSPYRHHPSMGPAIVYMFAISFGILFVLNVVTGMFWLPIENAIHRFLIDLLASATLAVLQILIFVKIKDLYEKGFGVMQCVAFVFKNVMFKNRRREYYHDLFVTLSKARARDKARAAQTMSRVVW